jgi:hypothetical protein
MSEFRAVTLVIVAMMLVFAAVCTPLALLRVGDEWVALAALVIGCAGAYIASCVVMRYGETSRHR